MPYCTSYFKFLFEWFWGFPEQNDDFAIQNMGERGYHFVSIAHSISSYIGNLKHKTISYIIYLWTGYKGDNEFMVSRDVSYDPMLSGGS